ncbi:RagB/SusD family nutrient uptake outer membrane protein [Persicobacter diffluens]|uniref:Membrane protein n=1 Tax=Persicobacter diffluens TaxID=981 RepID=A0AAN4VYQ3_9BACT|nr:membrane protein [Persicobacter diffluens]
MKRIFRNILLAVTLTFSAASCSLREDPYGFISERNFYETPQDARSALVYAYSILSDIEYYSRHYIIATEVPGEALTIKPDAGADQHELDRFEQQSNNQIITDMWRYAYIGINRCNSVIANVKDIPGLGEEEEKSILAEAKFLRALHYFNLVRFFGDVVLRTEQVSSKDDTAKGLSPMSEAYELIEQDLLEAEADLRAERSFGRTNQVAVQALLSKVYLHMASSADTGVPGYEWAGNAAALYQKAAEYASKVVFEQSVYEFEYDIQESWNVANRFSAKELIMVSATSRDGQVEGEYSKLPIMFTPYADGAKDLILPNGMMIRGGGFEHFFIEDAYFKAFETADKRKSEMIVDTVVIPAEGDDEEDRIMKYPGDLQSPFPTKFLDPEQSGAQTTCDTPILRFTDIMLVYAEAVGPTADAYRLVNMIRTRAGLADLKPGLGVAEFRNELIRERGWELAFEGHRLFDLRRTHNVEAVLEGEYGKTVTRGAYYYDIPQIEVDTNPEIN